jgi:hypothetical protein
VEQIWRTLFRALKACTNNEIFVSNRIIHAAWLVGVAVSPRTMALRLVELCFLAAKRPAWFQTVLTTVGNITVWVARHELSLLPRRLANAI